MPHLVDARHHGEDCGIGDEGGGHAQLRHLQRHRLAAKGGRPFRRHQLRAEYQLSVECTVPVSDEQSDSKPDRYN